MENNVVYFTEAKAYDLMCICHAIEFDHPGVDHPTAWEAAKTIYDLYMSRPEIHAEEGPEEYAIRVSGEVLK